MSFYYDERKINFVHGCMHVQVAAETPYNISSDFIYIGDKYKGYTLFDIMYRRMENLNTYIFIYLFFDRTCCDSTS